MAKTLEAGIRGILQAAYRDLADRMIVVQAIESIMDQRERTARRMLRLGGRDCSGILLAEVAALARARDGLLSLEGIERGLLFPVCGYCFAQYGEVRTVENEGGVSHGICPECVPIEEAEALDD